MSGIRIVVSPAEFNKLNITTEPSAFVEFGKAYFIPENIELEDFKWQYEKKIDILNKKIAKLERAKKHILGNLK